MKRYNYHIRILGQNGGGFLEEKDGEWVKCKEAYESIDWLLELINELYKMNTIKEVRETIDECIINRKKNKNVRSA